MMEGRKREGRGKAEGRKEGKEREGSEGGRGRGRNFV
jgi:hypothetical protein